MVLAFIVFNGMAVAGIMISAVLGIAEDERKRAREKALAAMYIELLAPFAR